jgi:spore germination cell wall hydrolase CwlJ-like protein
VQEQKHYTSAKEIARKALNKQLEDITHGAMYFHQHKSTPSWAKEYILTATVGEHLFYKPSGGKAK